MVFFNIDIIDYRFKKSSIGIFKRLYENYNQLKSNTNPKYLSQMKIVCYHKKQKKIDLLIDENMTMDSMKDLFNNDYAKNVPAFIFERVFIEKNKKKSLYGQYIIAVRSLISGNKIEKIRLITYFTRIIKTKIHSESWLKKNTSTGKDFFNNSWICLKILSNTYSKENIMNSAEKFAYEIGLIAGEYVKSREMERSAPNSILDILTYTKYDREKLKFVFQKVCLGVNLSKFDNEDKRQYLRKYIGNFELNEDIDDSYSDLSYFFFKGVFKNLGGQINES